MDQVRISALDPELPALESKSIRAAISLVWPYSSSACRFALLLAEPDFRRRKAKGQVRVRFLGSSAKNLVSTGIGVGDEIVLRLRGAEFIQEEVVKTPGQSIDWELVYTETIIAKVFHDGNALASLELLKDAPVSALQLPHHQEAVVNQSITTQWPCPAFFRRVKFSERPLSDDPDDALADMDWESCLAKNRPLEQCRYRRTWAYSTNIPSPVDRGDRGNDDLDPISPLSLGPPLPWETRSAIP
ncbi:hypothetical protein T440DRAFT_169097 [Plenodomus tracheiphilus IPT5]|uniref:Uncharacterized protein n=1 Tax=Plenodomus tracheiphilus IPT5 TaxID=1408161 RepID=A0A6A7B1L7_9PLEO|nr:hypothetical protein T440DRAFT_169097 [Plenodomus tracheiphilus IPT5]